MSDIRSLLVGIVGGIIVLWIAKIYEFYRKKSIKNDIEFIEFENAHLDAMRESSAEMSRSSFRAIFAVFILIGIANIAPLLFDMLAPPGFVASLGKFIPISMWALIIALCFKFYQQYDNLKNYEASVVSQRYSNKNS